VLALRLLFVLTLLALAVCGGGYLITGDRRYLGWAKLVAKVAGAAALIFFGVLALERLL